MCPKKTERHVVQLNFDFCASVRLCEEYEKIAEKALTSPANTEQSHGAEGLQINTSY